MQTTNRNKLVLFKSAIITCMSAITGLQISGALVLATDKYLQSFHELMSVDSRIFIFGILTHFFLFMFVSISPWFLFSKFLTKTWLLSSFIMSLCAGLLISVRNYLVIEKYPLMSLCLQFLDTAILGGFIVAIPQWMLLKKNFGQRSYYWLIVNFIGWGIVGLLWMQQLPLSYILMGKIWTVFFDFVQQYRVWSLVELGSFIPLGLGIGLFFTQLESRNDQIESFSPILRSEKRAGK